MDEIIKGKEKLEISVGRLEEEQIVRDRFIATLTHDLRNPLSAVKMSADLIGLLKGEPPSEILACAEKIVRNVDRADRMIKDLLDANLLRAGEKLPLQCKEFNLSALVLEVVASLISVLKFIFSHPTQNSRSAPQRQRVGVTPADLPCHKQPACWV